MNNVNEHIILCGFHLYFVYPMHQLHAGVQVMVIAARCSLHSRKMGPQKLELDLINRSLTGMTLVDYVKKIMVSFAQVKSPTVILFL